jgi:hypothetical protein
MRRDKNFRPYKSNPARRSRIMKKTIILVQTALFIIITLYSFSSEHCVYAEETEKPRLALIGFNITGRGFEKFPDLDKVVHEWLTTFLVETNAFEYADRLGFGLEFDLEETKSMVIEVDEIILR